MSFTTPVIYKSEAAMEIKVKNLAELELKATMSGVEYFNHGSGHIRLVGPITVNYYPTSKNKTAYIQNTKKGFSNVTPERALQMCFEVPEANGVICKRRANTRNMRQAILRKIKNCHWCGAHLTIDTSTVEHIIPLARGGLENASNRTLACPKCNHSRGSNMPELESMIALTIV